MKGFKKEIIFLLPLVFFYFVWYLLLPIDPLEYMVYAISNIIFYSPLVTFLVSMGYAALYGFSFRFSLLTALVFLLTIFIFHEWIPLYQCIYFLLSLAGNGIGYLIYQFRAKNSKTGNIKPLQYFSIVL